MNRSLVALVTALLLCAWPLAQQARAAQQAPAVAARPNSPLGATSSSSPRTIGSISGQVTAATNAQPLDLVTVTLTGAGGNPIVTVTGDHGEFAFDNVPAGSYSLRAARASYLTTQYGQSRPREAGRRIDLRAGGDAKHADIAMSREAAISGRIRVRAGDPASGVAVEAIESRYIDGRRRAVAAAVAVTNDRGEFRIGDLNPGRYTVRASTVRTWQNESNGDAYAYAITYAPGTAAPETAEAIDVAIGQEVSNLDITLSVARAATIRGRIETTDGKPVAGQRVDLTRMTSGESPQASAVIGSARSADDGGFVINRIPPGEYVLSTVVAPGEGSGAMPSGARRAVTVVDGDVSDIVLTLRSRTSVTGTISTDEGRPPPFPAARLQIASIVDGQSASWSEPETPQPVREDWSFLLSTGDGKRLFRVNGLPDDWMLKSVILNGRDLTDVPLEIDGRPLTGLQLVVSRNGASVLGVVLDAHGAPLGDSSVVVFAADPSRWGAGTRYVRSVRPDVDGRFVVSGLPPGAYLVVPQDFVAEGEWEDPEFLGRIADGAVRVSLETGTSVELSLTLEMP